MDLKTLISKALEEDVGSGDLTTNLTVDKTASGTARVISRSAGVLSGLLPFTEVFRQLDSGLTVTCLFHDGHSFDKGDVICELSGPIASILTGERTALNFLGRLSGIATLTRRYVDEVEGTKAVILDTRKTTPLLRSLEKAAVRHGGGDNHRAGLYDMILIKDNHEYAAGGVGTALSRVTNGLDRDVKVEVEVQTVAQLDEVMKFKVDRILLDNFTPDMIRAAVAKVNDRVPIEVSGGISLENVRQIALSGVDFISVGALTHSAPSVDFTLLLKK